METDKSLVDKNKNGRVSWINHRFFRAFVAGVIVGSGLLMAFAFRENFMIQPETMLGELVTDIGIPILGVYLVAKWGQYFLSRYGFAGFSSKRNEGMTIAQVVIGLVGFFLGPMILFLIFSFVADTYERLGRVRAAGLTMVFILGSLAFIALRRRLVRIRSSARSGTELPESG